MPTAPISSPSVADRWATAWDLPMYQIAPPDFDHTLMARLEAPAGFLRMLQGTSLTALGVALKLGLRGEEPARLQAMAERARPVLDGVVAALGKAEPVIAEQVFEIRLYLTLLAHAARPALPALPVLRDIASDWANSFGTRGRYAGMHPMRQSALRHAAHLALLAGDADVFARIVARVPPASIAQSRHWALYAAIQRAAAAGRTLAEALQEPECAAKFAEMHRLHRLPVLTDELGDEGCLFVPPYVGNYLYAWVHVRMNRPEMEAGMDWATMRGLMTG